MRLAKNPPILGRSKSSHKARVRNPRAATFARGRPLPGDRRFCRLYPEQRFKTSAVSSPNMAPYRVNVSQGHLASMGTPRTSPMCCAGSGDQSVHWPGAGNVLRTVYGGHRLCGRARSSVGGLRPRGVQRGRSPDSDGIRLRVLRRGHGPSIRAHHPEFPWHVLGSRLRKIVATTLLILAGPLITVAPEYLKNRHRGAAAKVRTTPPRRQTTKPSAQLLSESGNYRRARLRQPSFKRATPRA